MTALAAALPDIAELSPEGDVLFTQFHEGQREAYWSESRITLVLAGTQGGKTAVGPPWLHRQMQLRGAGDYMVVAPNFPLMEKKALPEFLRFFRDCLGLGEYKMSPVRRFAISREGERRLWGVEQTTPTNIFFGYGEDPDSLESATIKAVWIDEGGQRSFKRESWDAVLRRLSIEEGPVLLTTTPYTLGWLSELHAQKDDPASDIRVINFPSLANPRFPRSEWERAKRTLPAWKFNMFYRGLFERPAGLIYDCWDDAKHRVAPFTIPEHWPRFLGADFGGVNTAAIFLAQELDTQGKKTGRYIGYREYHAGGRTARQHAEHWRIGEPRLPRAFGGSRSEGQWRDEFAQAGLPMREPPVADVEVGINRVYGVIKHDNLLLFDTLTGTLDQMHTYSRVLDERGEATEGIEDKETFHYLDALRYGVAGITGGKMPGIWVLE